VPYLDNIDSIIVLIYHQSQATSTINVCRDNEAAPEDTESTSFAVFESTSETLDDGEGLLDGRTVEVVFKSVSFVSTLSLSECSHSKSDGGAVDLSHTSIRIQSYAVEIRADTPGKMLVAQPSPQLITPTCTSSSALLLFISSGPPESL
jgi:hypothetical protein